MQRHFSGDKAEMAARLRKVEGQVRGIARMIEEDRYCVDVLVQIAAVRAALNQVGLSILRSHTRGCVASAIREGDGDAAVEELIDTLMQFLH